VKEEAMMFGIEWLRDGSPVERETSTAMNQAAAIASANERALDVAKSHVGREPDSFRLTDATGRVLGVYPIGFDEVDGA
jgi:hypothetical protein